MDILIRKSGAIGHITLNRPNALNSLTYDMILAIEKALDSWFLDKEISLEVAALQFSSEKETRLNGGAIINPSTGDRRFELTKMDPVLYNQIRDLNDDEISVPLLDEDRSGLKKYKILKVTNRYDEHVADYSKDYVKIKELALKEKKLKAIKKWMEEKIELTFVSLNKDYYSCQFSNNWPKN